MLAACGVERPLVERFDDGAWLPEPFQIASVGGQRSGASVAFVLRLAEPSGRSLVVEGTIEIDPQATLVDGHWIEHDGHETLTGAVSSAAIDFFGGQGGRPSLGGQFTLSTTEASVYRVNLPTTRLTAER